MGNRAERMERRFEVPVLVAAVLVIPVIVIEEADAVEPWSTIAAVGNWAIWLVFAAELVATLAVVPNRSEWVPHHPLEVALVILTPPFVPPSMQSTRALRLLRVPHDAPPSCTTTPERTAAYAGTP